MKVRELPRATYERPTKYSKATMWNDVPMHFIALNASIVQPATICKQVRTINKQLNHKSTSFTKNSTWRHQHFQGQSGDNIMMRP